MHLKKFRVKVLDFKYLSEFEHLNFQYLFYEVMAKHEKEAIKKARELYMKGQKGISVEEIPIILKLFTIDQRK